MLVVYVIASLVVGFLVGFRVKGDYFPTFISKSGLKMLDEQIYKQYGEYPGGYDVYADRVKPLKTLEQEEQ